jgi:hypothetical protein
MSAPRGFADIQACFTAHLRDPQGVAPPDDVEPRRVAVYARLLFSNINSLLTSCFPVLRAITPDADWQALVRGFYAEHRSRSPVFPRIPQEFALYLAHERGGRKDPPYLAELADYEWLELEVAQDPRELPDDGPATVKDVLDGAPALNPLARLRTYRYPVHTIAPDRLPDAPGMSPTWLVVFRRRDDSVTFVQMNAVSARLVELIAKNDGATGRELLGAIAGELAHPRPDRLLEAGRAILEDLRRRELLLG